MASTNFIDKTTVVPTAWLNEVNGTVWTLFNAASTPAAGRTALGLGTISTQNSNSVNITGGSISGLSGTFTTTSSSGGDFVVFSNTATGSEAATRINTTQASSGVALKLSNSSLNVQASVRGRSDGGLSFYSGQGAGASSTSGVQALDVNPEGDVVVGNSPRINGGRILTVFNTDPGAAAYSRTQIQTNAGSAFFQVASIAGGRAANLYSSTGGSLNIFTQDSQSLNLGANNVATRLTISSAGAVNAAVSLSENSTRVFSRNSSAAPAAANYVARDTEYNFTHGLAQTPVFIVVWFECINSSANTSGNSYAVGDRIFMTTNNSSSAGVTISADATKVYVTVTGNVYVADPTTASTMVTLNDSALSTKWTINVRAWY